MFSTRTALPGRGGVDEAIVPEKNPTESRVGARVL